MAPLELCFFIRMPVEEIWKTKGLELEFERMQFFVVPTHACPEPEEPEPSKHAPEQRPGGVQDSALESNHLSVGRRRASLTSCTPALCALLPGVPMSSCLYSTSVFFFVLANCSGQFCSALFCQLALITLPPILAVGLQIKALSSSCSIFSESPQ